MNITELVQEKLGNSIYTTILAQYAGFPEQLLQWYVNEKPVGSGNTMFHVNYDGLNTYLRFKHDVNETFGTFMLKVNGTNWKDTLNLPNAQKFFASSKSFFSKIVSKVLNGNIHSGVKAIPDSQSDTSSTSFLSRNRPKVVGLGEERKQQTKSPSHYAKQDSMDSSGTGLFLNKNEHTNRLFIREMIRLGENRKQNTKPKSQYVSQDSFFTSEQQLGSSIEDTNDIDPLVPIDTTSQSTPPNLCELRKLYRY